MVNRLKQTGHTLVELMIAMAIAGLLMAGVAQAFFANTQTFGVVSEQSMIQENGRLALQVMGTQLAQTGYIREASAQHFYGAEMRADQFPDVANVEVSGLNFHTGAVVAGINNDAGSEIGSFTVQPGSDVVLLRYQKAAAGTLFYDCAGESLNVVAGAPDTATVGFFVDSNMALRCIAANGSSEEIIDGVEDLQILYGVDADGADPARADRYKPAVDMTEDDWRRVVAVSVALLVRPGKMAVTPPRTNVARSFTLNDEVRAVDGSVARTVYNQTFQIRNRTF